MFLKVPYKIKLYHEMLTNKTEHNGIRQYFMQIISKKIKFLFKTYKKMMSKALKTLDTSGLLLRDAL
ncbi:hypothetical protein FWK35_00024951 [Aphis craccivora]|uniref:Uncharacterized protein n=1 Tax=Aphis craccivora TaxID=307492 RepID=A0A6G0Y581_APHCR|nr:hypothetical protein FWK35_00024951 [Aphis craccivora]